MLYPYRQRLGWTLETVTGPASEPVTVSELRTHLRLNDSSEDTQLAGFISSAREQFEALTYGRICLPTTFRQNFDGWPDRPDRLDWWRRPDCHLKLAVGNVTSLTSVTYLDESDMVQTLAGCVLDATGTPALVYLPSGDYPALSQRTRPVSVTFVAGWADANSVPAGVKLGIKLLAAHYFGQREAYGEVDMKKVPMSFERFCDSFSTGLGGV